MSVVPTADSTANDYESQVVGNKADAAVTSAGNTASLMAYMKGLVGVEAAGPVVQSADSTNNTYVGDVVGNKSDGAQTTVGTTRTLMAYLKGALGQLATVITAVGTTIPALFGVPGADVATNTNERDVIGNKADAAVNTLGAVASLMAYIKGIVTAVITTIPGTLATLLTATGIGTTFVVKKTLTSSAILQTGVDVTGVSSGGALELLNVVLQTGGVGLAGGTNFQLVNNNANGATLFMAEAVISLGSAATVDLTTASVAKQKFILESGKKITAKATIADCTGVGTIDIYLVFRRNAAAATVAAAA